MRPMLEQVQATTGKLPEQHLADGGFGSAKDIEWAHAEGVAVHCPPTQSKHGTDPLAPHEDDGPGVAAWRERMASEQGQAQYKKRSICECIHARWRNWNLIRLTVRGVKKVTAVMLWYALANNILAGPSDDEGVGALVRSGHQYPRPSGGRRVEQGSRRPNCPLTSIIARLRRVRASRSKHRLHRRYFAVTLKALCNLEILHRLSG